MLEQSSLPQGWIWIRLEDISQKINPGFPSGKHNRNSQGIPHLRPMNINANGQIDLSDVKYVQFDDYDHLLKGDVLFNNTNSPELIGKTAYIKDNTNWAYSNHITRIRLNTSLINPAWISYC
jgi:type I restriction enzyme S subunit